MIDISYFQKTFYFYYANKLSKLSPVFLSIFTWKNSAESNWNSAQAGIPAEQPNRPELVVRFGFGCSPNYNIKTYQSINSNSKYCLQPETTGLKQNFNLKSYTLSKYKKICKNKEKIIIFSVMFREFATVSCKIFAEIICLFNDGNGYNHKGTQLFFRLLFYGMF